MATNKIVNTDRLVVVSGIADGTKPEDVTHFFDKAGKVVQITFCDDVAFVEFEESTSAARAVVNLNGCELNGSKLFVQLPTMSHIDLLMDNIEKADEPQDAAVTAILQLMGKLSISQKDAIIASLTGITPPKPSPQPQLLNSHPATTLITTQVPHLPTFSGNTGKGEVSFQRWKYEVKCLKNTGLQENLLLQAIRRSLRGTPADVLTWMGETATVQEILCKLEGLYGTVMSGEALIQKFYSERMLPDESVTNWGCRLEELLSQAVALGKIEPSAMNGMLKAKFWSDLADDRLKNATRHKVDTTESFTQLCMEVHAVEQELKESDAKKAARPVKHGHSHVMQDASNNKQDELLNMIKALSQKLDRLETKVYNPGPRQNDSRRQCRQQAQQTQPSSTNDTLSEQKKEIICFRCGHSGHVKSGCRVKKEDFKPRKTTSGNMSQLN